MTAAVGKSVLLVIALTSWSGSGIGTSAALAQGYAVQSPQAYYYPSPGHYNTTSGMVWVPAPGYYHVVPVYFYPPGSACPTTATVWRPHPAPSPVSPAMAPRGRTSGQVHTDWYWHLKNINTTAEHEAWIRQQQTRAGRR